MSSILAAFGLSNPDSLRRAIATGLGGLALLATPLLAKVGLTPDSGVVVALITAITTLTSIYVGQSGARAIVQAHADGKVAAAQVTSVAQADSILTKTISDMKDPAATPTVVSSVPPPPAIPPVTL